MTLERGTLLHKRYRIVEILGQGGMGSVYRAVDENLGVDVAVKENLFTTDEYARQFRLEAVILANLRHPNLTRVTDHFVIGDQGQYLVMDYIDGEDLRQRMERQGNIVEDEAILLGASICDALTYLHTRKPPILHRDIKPGNVKITPEGHIFLVDFGLAKVLHGSQATTTGARAMTPGYSPPEQYGTARTDPRTDIYSLGATLYASLTGIIPEDGLARAMDNTQLTPLRKRNGKVSRRLSAAIEKAMGIDPADRFQTAEEFKRALLGSKSKTQRLPGEYVIQPAPSDDGASENLSVSEKESRPIAALREEVESEELPAFKPPKRRKKKKKRILTVVLLVLFLLAATMVGFVRLAPHLVPPVLMGIIPREWISFISAPLPFPVTSDTSSPTPTEVVAVITNEPLPTETPSPEPTSTEAIPPTPTLPPVVEVTVTPENTTVPVPTQTGGGSGQIAFASSRTGVPQIYLVNLDTSGLTQLTDLDEGACQPSWSPDGAQIVFISPCAGRADLTDTIYRNSSLYVMNADGTGQKPLTNVPSSDFDPAWSPDGKHIAFTSLRDGRRDIYLLTVETGTIVRLTTVGGDVQENIQPSWSPAGNLIVYTVRRFNAYQIWVMDDTGQGNVQIARSGQRFWDYLPVWSRDGSIIMFSQRDSDPSVISRPWLMSIRYEDRDTLNPSRPDLTRPIEDVEFSPDGLWIVFEGRDSEGNRDIYFMTPSGGNRTRLTNDPAVDFDPAWRPSR